MPPTFVVTQPKANTANLNLASSVEELLGGVCMPFRPSLRRTFCYLRDTAQKASHAQEALRSFKAHQAAGTFPPAINSLHPPLLQCSKEFTADVAGLEVNRDIDTDVYTAKTNILGKFIAAKEDELKFFMENFAGKDASEKIVLEGINGAKSLLEMSYMVTEQVPMTVITDLEMLIASAGLYASQAVALGFAAHRSTLERKMKKMSLQESTTVEMTDQISTATIEKVVNDTLKRHSSSLSRKRKNTGESGPPDDPLSHMLTIATPRPTKANKTTKGQHPGGSPPPPALVLRRSPR
jgi:hypothetical protein